MNRLDAVTVSKIQILGGPKEYVPVLQAYIGAENLPSNYGGSLPPLDCDIHPYTEIMTDYAALNNNSSCNSSSTETSSTSYCSVLQKSKKSKSIQPSNFGEIVLCQIRLHLNLYE